MSSIILYLGLCFLGYLLAIPLRNHKEKIKGLGLIQSVAVLLLVFTMGARVGANQDVVVNLGKYGLYALLFTFNIFLFSLLALALTRRLMGIDRYGSLTSVVSDKDKGKKKNIDQEPISSSHSFTFYLLISLLLGLFVGYKLLGLYFTDYERMDSLLGTILSVELSTLLVFVGIDLGLSGNVVSNFKLVGFRVLFVPLAVCLGSLLGALITGLILPLSIRESMAIGAGLGWYSLGPAIMMDAGLVAGGAISFLHNLMREFFSLLLIPIVAKKVGYVESVALPGSTAMDVCLPIVAKSTNANIAVYSFVSGVLLSAAVPILVAMFI